MPVQSAGTSAALTNERLIRPLKRAGLTNENWPLTHLVSEPLNDNLRPRARHPRRHHGPLSTLLSHKSARWKRARRSVKGLYVKVCSSLQMSRHSQLCFQLLLISYRDSEDSGNAPLCPHFHNNHVKNSNTCFRYVILVIRFRWVVLYN